MRRSEYFTTQLMAYLTIALMSLPHTVSDNFASAKAEVKKSEEKMAVLDKKAVDIREELLFRY